MVEESIAKAAVLIEALPYIQEFRNEMIVVKFGGSAMEVQSHYDGILKDVTFMECVGMLPIIVHGGGKSISRRLTDAGVSSEFIQGLRVTDADAIDIVHDVLSHEINPGIVNTLTSFGARAQYVPGEKVFSVKQLTGRDEKTGEDINWGFVGDVLNVDTRLIDECVRADIIPVVTPVGIDEEGRFYNINADDAATAVAKAVQARKLAFLSDIPGLMTDLDDPESLMPSLKISEVSSLVERGVISGGMLPKVTSAVEALHAGVRKIHIIDGRLSHSLLLEIFTQAGVGTEIIHDPED